MISEFPFVLISFLTYNSFILGSWAESYPGNEIPPNIHGYSQIDQYKTTNEGNFYVFQVVFATLNEIEGNGGAICVDAATNLLIESSSFINCHANGAGGAVYFNNSNGISFLKKVCSTNSYSSTPSSHFCYISTKNSDNCTNCMEHSSVANLKFSTVKDANVDLENSGVIILKYDNISNNQCFAFPALWCVPSISSSVSYTSFENNTSTEHDVIGFQNSKVNDINTCNVIGNAAKYAIIYVWDSLKISNSCLIENTEKMFIFGVSGNTCTIINSTIDSIQKYNGYGSVTVDSIPSQSFINNLDNNGCFSMNDSYDIKDSNSKCRTFKMIGNGFNMLRSRDNYILVIF